MSQEENCFDKIRRERAEADAFAKEHSFSFCIFHGTRYEYRAWESEERDATEEEMALWTALGGPHA